MIARLMGIALVAALGLVCIPLSAGELEVDPALERYRQQLRQVREEFGGVKQMPAVRFFFFGMGNRVKLIYRNGMLLEALTGNALQQWSTRREVILPPLYKVQLELVNGSKVSIVEDENGVWVKQGGLQKRVEGTAGKVVLPTFASFKYDAVLRVLHQEILINVLRGRPLPNFLVYSRPWRRDAAMMAMCLQKYAT